MVSPGRCQKKIRYFIIIRLSSDRVEGCRISALTPARALVAVVTVMRTGPVGEGRGCVLDGCTQHESDSRRTKEVP
jgi:hypothetical protein